MEFELKQQVMIKDLKRQYDCNPNLIQKKRDAKLTKSRVGIIKNLKRCNEKVKVDQKDFKKFISRLDISDRGVNAVKLGCSGLHE